MIQYLSAENIRTEKVEWYNQKRILYENHFFWIMLFSEKIIQQIGYRIEKRDDIAKYFKKSPEKNLPQLLERMKSHIVKDGDDRGTILLN